MWKDSIFNDFEPIIFEHYPEIEKIKTELYQAGAIYASLTGTGSAVYGLFENAINLGRFEKYTCWQGRLLDLE